MVLTRLAMFFHEECGLHNTKLWTRNVMPGVPAKKSLCFSLLAISADEISFFEMASILNTFNSNVSLAHVYGGGKCLLSYWTRRWALSSYRQHHTGDNDNCAYFFFFFWHISRRKGVRCRSHSFAGTPFA